MAREVHLDAGTVRYRDEGDGEPLVFVHGALVNGDHWRNVVPHFTDEYRCLVPDVPVGAHRVPMAPDADLTPPGIASMLVDFLDAMELERATFVGNDTGGALCQLVVANHSERVGRLVLTNCDAFSNFLPPRYRYLQYGARVPGFVYVHAKALRFHTVRVGSRGYGPLSSEPMPREVLDGYGAALNGDPGVRRDFRKLLRGISPSYTENATESFPDFGRPVLLAWGPDDPVFPIEHAHRLAELFPNATVEAIEGAHAFVPEDRPERLASVMRSFLTEPDSVSSKA